MPIKTRKSIICRGRDEEEQKAKKGRWRKPKEREKEKEGESERREGGKKLYSKKSCRRDVGVNQLPYLLLFLLLCCLYTARRRITHGYLW